MHAIQKGSRNGCSQFVACLFIACLGCGSGGKPVAPVSADDLMKGIVTAQPAETPESLAAKKSKLESNLSSAKELIAKDELDTAIGLLEDAVGLDPKNREVLFLLVKASQARSKQLLEEDVWKSYRLIVQAGGYMRTVHELHPELSPEEKKVMADVLFDEACSHGRSKRYEEFRGSLGAALAAGFADPERIKNDADIKPLWEVPELKDLLTEAVATASSHSP